jgi:CelD/BcsL family acetyltransferase involved in cellulose biosynthesis
MRLMNDIVFVDSLTVRDTLAVARLERICQAHVHRQGKKYFQELLRYVDQTGYGLNLGLYAGTRLIGYIFSHAVDSTATSDIPCESVIHIDSIAVHPSYRQYFGRLLAKQLCYLKILFPEHVIENNDVGSMVQYWFRHKRFFLRNGYELEETPQRDDTTILGKTRHTARWRPFAQNGTTSASRRHHIHRPRYIYNLDGQDYSIETWTNEGTWHELIPYWNALQLRSPEPTMFQTYEYQRIWWRHFGLSRSLFILVIRHGHEVIGIAPLEVAPVVYYGKCFRELGFIGVNWEVDRPKFLFGNQAEICSTLTARFLNDNEHLWDLVRLYEQREDSFTLTDFRSGMQGYGYLTAVTKDAVAPYLRTDTTWETYNKSLSARMRKNLKAARNKLGLMGDFKYIECKSYPDVLDKLSWYKQIEQKSWKGAARVGPSKHGHYYRFFEALAGEFGKTGQFHIRFLTMDDQPIAGTFGLEFNNTFYSLHIAHDHEYSKYSLGTLLEYMELESCFTGNCQEYDFLGSFLNNKMRWTSTVRTSKELHVYQKKWQLVLLYVVYHRIKPFIKSIVMKVLKDKVQLLVKFKEKIERAANRRPTKL